MLFHDNSIKISYPQKALRLLKIFDVNNPENPRTLVRRLMSFRNETVLHKRKCDATGDSIISAYKQDSPYKVYNNEYWWSDAWEPMDYGVDFDFSKSFFEQYKQLQLKVPREGTSVFRSENCDYNGHIRDSKNCYMSSLIADCEDTHYSYWCANNEDVVDSTVTNESTLCYECIDCKNLYECVYCQECVNSRNCYFSYQLIGCENCIGCSNLSHKKYWAFNQKVSPEQFNKIKNQIFSGKISSWKHGLEYFDQMFSTAGHRALHNLNCENSIGDHLYDSKNCYMSFDQHGCEDVNYSISGADSKDVLSCYSAGWKGCQEVFSSAVTRGSTDIMCCYYTFYSNALRYCEMSMSCSDNLGCIGLKRKSNCILNKAYTKHEYETISAKIIEHMKETKEWGSFFPSDLSSFAYNETAANFYWPMDKKEALELGYKWNDELDQKPGIDNISELPKELPETHADETYACSKSGMPYKVMPLEFKFYKKLNLPLPDLCLNERRVSRADRRNKYFLRKYTSKDGKSFYTSFMNDELNILSEQDYLNSLE